MDALRRCDADPAVITCVASLFAADRKLDKARSWYNRAVALAPLQGDNWARYLAFEHLHGTPAEAEAVAKRAVEAAPRYGELWTSGFKIILKRATAQLVSTATLFHHSSSLAHHFVL